MTKKEWKDVFDNVLNQARKDYQQADRCSKDEKVSFVIMRFAYYISNAIKDLED